ncbi:MAG TPA: NIPSNAP family protein [Pseudolabrys sp.]|nr:NIPSNAP family protein [Pseudolabrys sp.]
MIIDLRTYKCLPGHVPAQLELYGKLGYPVQQRHIGDPLCYLVTESGGLNTLVHAWVYESAADREAKRGRMAQDPEWRAFLVENAKAGHLLEQNNWLMTSAPFAPPLTVGKPKG